MNAAGTKSILVFSFVVLDQDGGIQEQGTISGKDRTAATIALARQYPKVDPAAIILNQWATGAEVRDLDAIATVRVVEGSLTPAKSSKSNA
jgi:hypothetical protein